MDPISLLIIGRITERIAIIVIAGLSIWIGFKLFFHTLPPQEGEIDLKEFKIKLTSVGPGIFFALFGVVLMYQVVNVKLGIETETIANLDRAISVGDSVPSTLLTNPKMPQKNIGMQASDVGEYVINRMNLSFLSGHSSNDKLFPSINTIIKLSQDFPFDGTPYQQIGDIDTKKLGMAANQLKSFRDSFAYNYYGDEEIKRYFELKKKGNGYSKDERLFIAKLNKIYEKKLDILDSEEP